MNELSQMRTFGLLSEISQEVTNEEMKNIYNKFVEQIRTVKNENDYSTIYRIIGILAAIGRKQKIKIRGIISFRSKMIFGKIEL